MSKKTRALSGASQDAYFRRVLKAHPSLSADERDSLVRRLRQEVAQLRLRRHGPAEVESPSPRAIPTAPQPAGTPSPFDPFSPNVIVVVRTSGRDAALAALAAIESLDHLHALAREQRLAVAIDVASAADLRAAIVTAAERRIANRMAAAS
jgi:hypothetical protein